MDVTIDELKGKIFTEIVNNENNELIFTCDDGSMYKMFHSQDCCESVCIDDINGDLNDLLNTPILLAEEVSNSDLSVEQLAEIEKEKAECLANDEEYYNWGESFTWTFYKFSTVKGDVSIKWYGQSNGYYSESVEIVKANKNGNFNYWED